jgi:hypothetical protein
VPLVFGSEPEAEIDENVKESDQVRLIDRNRVFDHLKFSTSIFSPDIFYLK